MNTNYEVRSSGGAQITLRLSQNYSIGPGANNVTPAVGDRVSVRGTGTTPWRILTGTRVAGPGASGAMAGLVIDTADLPGNASVGVKWSTRLQPAMWHAVATDNLGRIVVAADNPGQLRVSSDGGQTWGTSNAPSGLNWVAVAVANEPGGGDQTGYANSLLLAAAYGGGLYFSHGGATWEAASSDDPAIDFSNREWEAVIVNQGGGGAAAVLNGPIYYTDGTIQPRRSWGQATLAGSSTPLVRPWRAMANARGGATTVAVSEDGGVFVSTDAARTWVQRPVTIAGSV
ncbi:MAG: WD40/YVTN/BNR-like repeat-containing protein, partial [Catenulispora sp.]